LIEIATNTGGGRLCGDAQLRRPLLVVAGGGGADQNEAKASRQASNRGSRAR
jgi:hypothetical protein